MALRDMFKKLSTSVSDDDTARLREFCAGTPHTTPINEVAPRSEATIVGEISTLRIVPRAGSPTLQATITDGTGYLTAVWTGRRRIAGVAPGKRLVIAGRGAPTGPNGRLEILNPRYELL
jgi:RecG-like helicase